MAREKSGVWGSAVNVPGLAVLNFGNYAAVNSVSCGAVGNCSAGGFYLDQNGHQQAFVVNQKNAVWGNAKEVSLPNINNARTVVDVVPQRGATVRPVATTPTTLAGRPSS